VPVEVAELAEDRQREGRGEHRQRDQPRQVGLAGAEVVSDGRDRERQDGDRERRREQPGQRDEQHRARVAATGVETRRDPLGQR
jgi:hypothetical protein